MDGIRFMLDFPFRPDIFCPKSGIKYFVESVNRELFFFFARYSDLYAAVADIFIFSAILSLLDRWRCNTVRLADKNGRLS